MWVWNSSIINVHDYSQECYVQIIWPGRSYCLAVTCGECCKSRADDHLLLRAAGYQWGWYWQTHIEFPPHRPLNRVWCGWNHFPCWFSVKDKARVGISIYRLVFVIGQINTNPIITPQPSKPISNGDPPMILLQIPEYFPHWKKLGPRLQFVPFWCILNDAVGGGEGGWWRGFVLLAVTWKEHRERQSRVQTSYFYLYTTHTFPIFVS